MEKLTSKVTPVDIDIPPAKENNFLGKSIDIIRQIRFIIIAQMTLGINRLYLLNYHYVTSFLCYTYIVFVVGVTTYLLTTSANTRTSTGNFTVYKNTNCIEYLILVLVTSLFQRRSLEILFQDLASFDNMINISKHAAETVPTGSVVVWTLISIMYSVTESVIAYATGMTLTSSDFVLYVTVSAHDSEQIFFVTLIRTILLRIRILKEHIAKAYDCDQDFHNKMSKEYILSNNIQLDTSSMHRAYELLHKCAEQLNAIMSFPMIVMLFSSGLSTTILLKKFFQATQDTNNSETEYRAITAYTLVRCVKYTLLVVIPCFHASVTSNQVSHIRNLLHNAVNKVKDDKIERRKLKAFFQLVKDNNFTYALWGVIRLSMSLPLNYASLCTTYLIITIQFSKFID